MVDEINKFGEELNMIIDALSDGIFIADADANYLALNDSAVEIEKLDEDKQRYIGMNAGELVEEGAFTEDDCVTLAVKNTNQAQNWYRENYKGRDVMINGFPIFKNGKLLMIVVQVRDISGIIELQQELNEISKENKRMLNELAIAQRQKYRDEKVVFQCKKMQNVYDLCLRIASSEATVLLTGESGTGKGIFADIIHTNSKRNDKPFIKIDCTSIPESLFESELFGYEGGSFTGAVEKGKAGLIELADKGTVFFDEIGELPLVLQKKLLTLIQEKCFYRVGANKKKNVDVRIIAATNRNLEQMVKSGQFREDLYYRLSVLPITLPTLRERKEDIGMLLYFFLKKFNKKYHTKKVITPEANAYLENYNYPGNIRELENTVERLIVTTNSERIDVIDLPLEMREYGLIKNTNLINTSDSYKQVMNRFERDYLKSVMNKCSSTREMSEQLDIATNTITMKLKKHGIPITFKRQRKHF